MYRLRTFKKAGGKGKAKALLDSIARSNFFNSSSESSSDLWPIYIYIVALSIDSSSENFCSELQDFFAKYNGMKQMKSSHLRSLIVLSKSLAKVLTSKRPLTPPFRLIIWEIIENLSETALSTAEATDGLVEFCLLGARVTVDLTVDETICKLVQCIRTACLVDSTGRNSDRIGNV